MTTKIPEPPTEPGEFSGNNNRWRGVTKDATRGDTLAGSVIARDTIETEQYGGRTAPLLVVRDGDGEEVEVPAWRSHLAELIEEHDVQPGDGVAIRYFGPEPGGFAELYGLTVSKAGA